MPNNIGNGAVLSFSTSTVTIKVTEINAGNWTRGRVDKSGLEDDGPRKYHPGHLYDHDEVELTGFWDTSEALIFPLDGTSAFHEAPAAETVTLTWPLGAGETTAAKIVGTGFITMVGLPQFSDDNMQSGSLRISWDGATGPKYTEAA